MNSVVSFSQVPSLLSTISLPGMTLDGNSFFFLHIASLCRSTRLEGGETLVELDLAKWGICQLYNLKVWLYMLIYNITILPLMI